MNIKIIYWTGTGNTEKMAEAIFSGAQEAGTSVEMKSVSSATIEDVQSANILAFGCPSMGDEVLEENEMEPFITSIEDIISGKTILLFGSYGWGDGAWMRDWEKRFSEKGAVLVDGKGFISQEMPDDADLIKLKELGRTLAT